MLQSQVDGNCLVTSIIMYGKFGGGNPGSFVKGREAPCSLLGAGGYTFSCIETAPELIKALIRFKIGSFISEWVVYQLRGRNKSRQQVLIYEFMSKVRLFLPTRLHAGTLSSCCLWETNAQMWLPAALQPVDTFSSPWGMEGRNSLPCVRSECSRDVQRRDC